ncbi:discoidin domain-containing protein, partial [Streptomyces hydrogenans]|uniref:discoidin domain-containing protein n=1 Tax=Streptomyces hydrogenans TaxID=1873719 RepID=UPI003640DD62
GGVWINLLPDGLKRLSYYALKKAYTGSTAGDNTPPVISNMTVTPSGSAPAGGEFTIRADVRDPDGDAVTTKVFLSGNYANGDKRLLETPHRRNADGSLTVTAPEKLGVWKVYVQAEDGQNWRTIHTQTAGNGDIDTIEAAATARHVRLHLTARGTGWGYSLHEFGVYS